MYKQFLCIHNEEMIKYNMKIELNIVQNLHFSSNLLYIVSILSEKIENKSKYEIS